MDDLITEQNSPHLWWTVTVQYGNPYTDPPHGWPRIIWGACCMDPNDIQEIPVSIPPGYTVYYKYWEWTKTMHPETLYKARKTRLANAILKKTKGMIPFLAAEIDKRERQKKPSEYLDMESIRSLQEYRSSCQQKLATSKVNEYASELERVNYFEELCTDIKR